MSFVVYSKEWVIADKTAIEAGYVNDPDDSGGATNFGITEAVAIANKKLWSRHGFNGDMKLMPKSLAIDIYATCYWDKMRLTDIHTRLPMLADKLFDFGINAGTAAAGKALQRLLNVSNMKGTHFKDLVVDGGIGNNTIIALDAYIAQRGNKGLKVLLTGLLCMQGSHYVLSAENKEKNESFYFGWMSHRVYDDMMEYTAKL